MTTPHTNQPSPDPTNHPCEDAVVEAVNHPSHYQSASGIEVIDVIEAFDLDFHTANAVKYICRADKKTEVPLQDLKKAAWYLNRKINNLPEKSFYERDTLLETLFSWSVDNIMPMQKDGVYFFVSGLLVLIIYTEGLQGWEYTLTKDTEVLVRKGTMTKPKALVKNLNRLLAGEAT